jgi:hypothetical protein
MSPRTTLAQIQSFLVASIYHGLGTAFPARGRPVPDPRARIYIATTVMQKHDIDVQFVPVFQLSMEEAPRNLSTLNAFHAFYNMAALKSKNNWPV